MTTRNRVISLLVALAGLSGVAACGRAAAGPDGTAAVPVAQTRTLQQPSAVERLGDALAPAEQPSVAKVQKWVKIFSGPSVTDLDPPKSRLTGSHTVELNATPSDPIGTYVTDGAGRTLYRFDGDSASPPKSTCNGDCAKAWPPLLIKSPGKIFPDGINPKIIGYVERADHTCQVTIGGHPVYYFIADAKPGDINGQGVNGKWFAITPEGGRTKPLPGLPATGN